MGVKVSVFHEGMESDSPGITVYGTHRVDHLGRFQPPGDTYHKVPDADWIGDLLHALDLDDPVETRFIPGFALAETDSWPLSGDNSFALYGEASGKTLAEIDSLLDLGKNLYGEQLGVVVHLPFRYVPELGDEARAALLALEDTSMRKRMIRALKQK